MASNDGRRDPNIPADADALVAGIERLVTMPDIWIRINRLIDTGRSASEIARAIELDTDLSARLLRVVNSSFYNLAAPVDTITRAITVVGTLDLRDLAMLTVARRLFTGIPADLMDLRRFWQDAVGTGVLAGLLARICHLLHAERAFVMGVIHNIGLLAICQHLPDQAREILFIAAGDDEVLPDAEREILGYTHQEVGGALLRRWGLPDSLCQVAAFHHRPQLARAHRLEVAIVHAAALAYGGDAAGLVSEDILARLQPEAVPLIPLNPDRLDALRAEARQLTAELTGRLLGAGAH